MAKVFADNCVSDKKIMSTNSVSRKNMKVQVFIPTFNRAAALEKAVRSVLSQTYRSVEAVVLDNHSTDETQKSVARLMDEDPRVRSVRHPVNLGMTPNFNSIKDLVDADFFSVLTDDDEYEPCFVQTALKCFKENRSAGFVVCNAPTRVRGKIIASQLDNWKEGFYKANTAVLKCLSGQYPLITNCLFKSNLSRDFLFNPKLGNVADGLLLACLFAKYDSVVTKTITGYWNNDGENASSTQKYEPIAHINTVLSWGSLYKEFCADNGIPMRGRAIIELKKLVALLVAADKSSFEFVCLKSHVREHYGESSLAVISALDKIRFLRICTKGKSVLRDCFRGL